MSHTPGPWTFKDIPAGGWAILAGDMGVAVVPPNASSDARLIAAAPDLLAALEDVQKHLRPRPLSPANWIFDEVGRAIAKAKGE